MRLVEQVALWWGRKFRTGASVFGVGMLVAGVGVVDSLPTTAAATTTRTHTYTLHERRVVVHTRYRTVYVKGRVIRHHDHVLVVYVPRVVFHTRTTHRRIVVPAHVVRIEQPQPVVGVLTSAVIGVAPPPVTVTVPVTISVPVTVPVTVPIDVPGPTVTVTLPPETSTVTTTVTATIPPAS